MTVVQLLARALRARGVRVAWGMPGGDTLPLIDALAEQGIDFVLVRDEASAGFAADASAQLTGTVGLCAATLGPGVTNLVSGVAGCLLDRAPVLAITSRYRSDRHGTYTHMILDQQALLRPTAKQVVAMTAENAAGELRRALAVAQAPRPGPVWLEIPTEVAGAPTANHPAEPPPPPVAVAPPPSLAERVAGWERPVVLVGFAARHAAVTRLAEALRAPVLTSYKAKGALPEGLGWAAGAIGLSPRADAVHQALLARADGVLLLGWDPAELRDHWLPGWGAAPEVVVVDNHAPTDLPTRVDGLFVGPIAPAVEALAIRGQSAWTPNELDAHRAAWIALFEERVFGPATAIRAVQAGLVPGAVTSLDVGAHRITASHVWACDRPDRLLQSNGFSSMGYGLPAALAAAAHGHPAVCVVGDMGLQLSLGELGTAAEQGWPVVVVVLVDASLSLIALKQRRSGSPERAVRFKNPDWVQIAEAFGGRGVVARTSAEVTAAVREALDARTLTVIAVPIDPAPYLDQI